MAGHQNPSILTSWKEIAAHLGKGVRTVQRWEYEFGLPVRRPSDNRHIVHASCEELKVWLETWRQRGRPNSQDSAPGNGHKNGHYDGHNNGHHNNGHKLAGLRTGVETSRELRKSQRQLVDELQKSLNDLAGHCQAIALSIAGGPSTTAERRPNPAVPGE